MKEILQQKIKISEGLYHKCLNDWISTNTRKDRDRFLRIKYKLEAYYEILQLT